MGSSKKVTIGYKYFLGMHMVLCHGPIDSLKKIIVGERDAWSGNVASSQQIYVDSPDLFGGEKKEGGVQGHVDIMFGESTQAKNSYLTSRINSIMPAFRGVVSAVLRQCYVASMSPYPKAWAFLVKRCSARNWYAATAEISGGANAAHIIYEVLTNTQWGMGYAVDTIDDASFREVALTLFNENLGLSFELTNTDSIENFIYTVVQHVNGMFYTKPDTGKFALKLLRNNYVADNLDLYNEDNIITLESFERPSFAEMVNEIVVTYRPQGTADDDSVTVQDLAAISAQEGIISQAVSYPGIDNATNAARVAMRDLRQKSTPLARVKMKVLRSAWATSIGDCVRFSWTEHGVSNMILRVIGVNLGTMTGGEIIVDAIEDVFGLPNSTYIGDQPSGWVDPITTPQTATFKTVFESPYWDIVRTLSEADYNYLTNTSCFLESVVGEQTTLAINYQLWTSSNSGYTYGDDGQFCPHCMTTNLSNKMAGTVQVEDIRGSIESVTIGSYCLWDSEIVRIDAINVPVGVLTIGRGCLDTVPQDHAQGSRIYFADTYGASDGIEYVTYENVSAKILTRTGAGLLNLASDSAINVTMTGRFAKPYPPANFKIAGQYFPTAYVSTDGMLSITWAHRDRLQQTATILDFTQSSVGPESGVTYVLRILKTSNSQVLINNTGITGNSISVSLPTGNYLIDVELYSVRSGIQSLQKQINRLNFTYDGAVRITQSGDTRITEDGLTRIVE